MSHTDWGNASVSSQEGSCRKCDKMIANRVNVCMRVCVCVELNCHLHHTIWVDKIVLLKTSADTLTSVTTREGLSESEVGKKPVLNFLHTGYHRCRRPQAEGRGGLQASQSSAATGGVPPIFDARMAAGCISLEPLAAYRSSPMEVGGDWTTETRSKLDITVQKMIRLRCSARPQDCEAWVD